MAAIPILFPILKTQFNLSYTEVGVITGGGLLITLFFQLIIGRTADGKNSLTLLSTGILLLSLSLLLLTQSNGFLSLVLLIFFLRFASSFFHPIGVGWISRIFKKDRLDWAMGVQSGTADFGAFIAISTTLYLSEIRNWYFPLYIWSILGIIGLLIAIILTRSLNKDLLLVKRIREKQSVRDSLTEFYKLLKKIKILVPSFIISGASWNVTITFLPLLLEQKTSLPLTFIGLIVSIWIGIGSISSIFCGRICAIIKRKNVVILSYLIIGCTALLISYITNILLIVVALVLFGIFTFLSFPCLFSFISEATHETVESRTFGLIFTLQLGGGIIISFLSGFLSDVYGVWIPFALLGLLSLLICIPLLINYKKSFIAI